jgi:Biotin-lipoyl like
MAGVVVEIRVKENSEVKKGDPIAIMSAMKMVRIPSKFNEHSEYNEYIEYIEYNERNEYNKYYEYRRLTKFSRKCPSPLPTLARLLVSRSGRATLWMGKISSARFKSPSCYS